jgi:hypothetical protein
LVLSSTMKQANVPLEITQDNYRFRRLRFLCFGLGKLSRNGPTAT